MPNFTRKAIKESFVKMLNEKPLAKITVKDIVEDCGINRNTFYYHFEDIPNLLLEIVTEDAERIIKEYPSVDSIEQCVSVAVKFTTDNKKAVFHIYNSANRDVFERSLMSVCEHVVTVYANTLFVDRDIPAEDRKLMINFYKCCCFGICIDWINNGMKEDLAEDFRKLWKLRYGLMEEFWYGGQPEIVKK